MSYINSGQQLQKFIPNYGNVRRTSEVINWVLDISRNNPIDFVDNGSISVEGGKLRQLKVSYFPILAYNDVGCAAKPCDAGVKIAPRQVTFNLKQCTSTPPYEFDKDDIRYIDGQHVFSEIVKAGIASALPQWRTNFATDMMTLISTNFGLFLDGNTTHQVQPSLSTTGQINPAGFFDIQQDFIDAGLSDPYIIGMKDVFNWRESWKIGGLNLQGQDLSKLEMPNLYYDTRILNSVLGDAVHGGHIVAVDAMVMKYVSFSDNAGIFATEMQSIDDLDKLFWQGNQSFIYGTFYDPVHNIMLDFNCIFNPCGGTNGTGAWTMQLRHKWDIFILPEVSTNAVGPALNGIFHYRACVPVVLACPTGQAISPAVASRTYAVTPNLAVSPAGAFYVINTNIAGATWTSQQGGYPVANINDLAALFNEAAPPGYVFTVVGSTITYVGYSAITAILNNGEFTFTFA